MLSNVERVANREFIISVLGSTGRAGMAELIAWLDRDGFFEAPASTKYHGCYAGGLAGHSIRVHDKFCYLLFSCGIEVPAESVDIAALLHDVCKVGAYIGSKAPYQYNRSQPVGHSRVSIKRISKFIVLTPLEELLILHHMGVYGLNEFNKASGEYPLRGGGMANAWHHHPAVKLLYFADELATLEEKKLERGEPQNLAEGGAACK